MKLAMNLSYSGSKVSIDIDRVLEAERLGYDSVWSAEAYGSDAVTPAAWIAARTTRIHVGTAIMQIAARTPAMTAMTAMTLDSLSGGRFRLGVGVSGPQVVEGWHGQPFGKPLGKTREYVEIVRAILGREKPVEFLGDHYQIPYRGPDATGLDVYLRLAEVSPANARRVVFMTGGVVDEGDPAFHGRPCIRKPIDRDELDACLRRLPVGVEDPAATTPLRAGS